jgi:hypothetical protein
LKKSINDVINNDEIDTQINKDSEPSSLNLPKKDSDERFYE